MGWTGEHRGFVVEAYYENNCSVIATQRAFRTHCVLGRNASVPDQKAILLWISNLRATGSTLKRKSPGRPTGVRTPENVETVRASIQQSPKLSVSTFSGVLTVSTQSLHRLSYPAHFLLCVCTKLLGVLSQKAAALTLARMHM
jgi:hypothetical protein